MRRLLYAAVLAMMAVLMLAPAALAQQGPACPGGQVNVLLPSGEYTCVPPNIEDQTPEQITAVNQDPRPNAETPIVENQGIPVPGELTPAQQYAQQGIPQPTESQLEAAQNFAAGGPVSCEGFGSEFGAQQFYDFTATAEQQAILDPDGNGFACDTPTATQPAQSEIPVTTTALPATGGPSLALLAGALLVGAGLVLRRR